MMDPVDGIADEPAVQGSVCTPWRAASWVTVAPASSTSRTAKSRCSSKRKLRQRYDRLLGSGDAQPRSTRAVLTVERVGQGYRSHSETDLTNSHGLNMGQLVDLSRQFANRRPTGHVQESLDLARILVA
jgi:hypothetical protein